MKKTIEDWDSEEWKIMKEKLASLSLEDLKILCKKVGVNFQNNDFVDKGHISAKEQLILVLDEVDKGVLESEYNKIIFKKSKV